LGLSRCRVVVSVRGTPSVYLLRDVENFLRSNNFSAARFGREALRDPRFVFDLRNGREPRSRTVERVRAFLEQAQ